MITSFAISTANAQWYYQPQEYKPGTKINKGFLGELFNPQPFLIKNLPTIYHGNQDVYAMVYLPFITSQYDPFSDELKEPLASSIYTTGIALCSPQNPALGLYAPVQIIGRNPNNNSYNAFASIIPFDDDRFNYNGPFNTLPALNQQNPNFVNVVNEQFAITALEAAQKFTSFSHEILTDVNGQGWNGFDKAGNLPILCVINPEIEKNVAFYSPADDQIVLSKDKFDNIGTSRSVVAHEITHGIIDHIPGYVGGLTTTSKDELDEGLAHIIGLSFSNWLSPGKFNDPNWDVFWESFSKPGYASRPIHVPKIQSQPNTYLGKFYQTDPQDQNYDVHTNGAVLEYWFYLINGGGSGYVDDNNQNAFYDVLPLIGNNKEDTYKLALRILFAAFTEKLTPSATYLDVRKATLEAAVEFGYPSNSNVYAQIEKAWSAVGVESLIYNTTCVVQTAASVSNGLVSFNAQQGTISPDLQSGDVFSLLDCSNPNQVATSRGTDKNYFTDWDDDQVYTDDNNTLLSSQAVTIHAFTQIARDWYKKKLGHDGMDGSGHFGITNKLGNFANVTMTVAGSGSTTTISYPLKKYTTCRDKISQVYFTGVDNFVKMGDNQSHSYEWNTILNSIGAIFSLEIKKDYEQQQQNPNAESIWTLYEDLSDPSDAVDFSNPKLYGQAAVYNGQNWDNFKPSKNAGILNLWYYLLTHGTKKEEDLFDNGYQNDEPGSNKYYVVKQDKDLILKVIWEAYKAMPVNCSLEQFRLATHEAIQHILGIGYDPKGKEFIALTDAWAAVLGTPDYAASLAHFPADGKTVYPWAAKVGVEVEYPKYESERLFEVSRSANFSTLEFPVYQFVSSAAPDLATGMTYGYVNLEPGQTYYVHSRLSLSGNLHEGCHTSIDPVLCEALQARQKWTVTYEFKTGDVPEVTGMNPKAGQGIPAWESPMSWTSVEGSAGYNLHIVDADGAIAEQNIPVEAVYDEENADVPVSTTLALSRSKKYTWSVAARQKLGSEWACHVDSDFKTTSFTPEEKEAMPDANGNWSKLTDFQTGKPTIVLGDYPAQGQHIPLIGPAFFLTAKTVQGADQYKFEYNTPLYNGESLDLVSPSNFFRVSNVPDIADGQLIQWAFTPQKQPVAPFITELEDGETVWREFVADNALSPKPTLPIIQCIPEGPITISWDKVDGADGYQYEIIDKYTNQKIDQGISGGLKVTTNAVSIYKHQFLRRVSAGIKVGDGNWIFGPAAEAFDNVTPPSATLVSPINQTVAFGPQNSIKFSWLDPTDTGHYKFDLVKVSPNGNSSVESKMVQAKEITISDLEFNTKYNWSVSLVSAPGCPGPSSLATFKTEEEPIKIIPELKFELTLITKDDFGVPGADLLYNVTIHKPNGDVVFNKIQRHANIPESGTLPAIDGEYKVNILVSKLDDEIKDYKNNPAYLFKLILWDKGPANQSLDSDLQTGEFAPTVNAQIEIPFIFDASSNTLNH